MDSNGNISSEVLYSNKALAEEEKLSAYGSEACGLFRIMKAFDIEPNHFQVGIVRAKKLKNKILATNAMDVLDENLSQRELVVCPDDERWIIVS